MAKSKPESGRPFIELRKRSDDKWDWVLWSANGRPLAMNVRPYTRRNDAEKGMSNVIEEISKPGLQIFANVT